MIRKLENSNIQLIELGKGSTYISQVKVEGDTQSSGLAFSNHSEGGIHDNDIIIEIIDFKGVASLSRGLLELIKSWEIEGAEEHINGILEALKPMLNFSNIKEEE